MKAMIAMMKMIPKPVRRKIPAPMISQDFKISAKSNNTGIALNLDNLLTCADYCGGCPSKPQVAGEALYCASGKSSAQVEMKGCNCLDCPLFEQCGSDSIGYFCKYGVSLSDQAKENNKSLDLSSIPSELRTVESNSDKAKSKNSNTIETNSESDDSRYLERFTKKLINPNIMENEWNNFSARDDLTIASNQVTNICYQGDDKEIESSSNQTILELSLENDIPHVHICGGKARCSTCRVIVLEGLENCLPRTPEESKLANTKGFPPEVRLACQTKINGKAKIRRLVFDEEDSSEAIHEGKHGLNITGTEVEAAVLFSDIRSFTSFSEKNLPYDIIHILNRYFNAVGSHIDSNGGYIDKYMGDGIMVTFGLEERKEHPALLALKSAQEMIIALDDFNEYLRKHFNHEFQIGIGIHYGSVIVGNLGFQKKMEFTAIGDTVNTASRIESLNKKLHTKVLVSKEIYEITKKDFRFSKGFRSAVKGKEEKLQVYVPDFGVID
ncbi:MAG: 2Fe-2S iron-sulfur cluster binding domain-containing protein [Leptospira sp.]|nr:2Fe-2S iron-sulfur cluster binding domain-containing protein [Leptospira sp.]